MKNIQISINNSVKNLIVSYITTYDLNLLDIISTELIPICIDKNYYKAVGRIIHIMQNV